MSLRSIRATGYRVSAPSRICRRYAAPTPDDIIRRVSALTTIAVARRKRTSLCAMAVLVAAIVPPATFYGWLELHSRITADQHALDSGYANALKHAEAAATLYSIFRLVGTSDRVSERVVVKLGILNEYAEMYVKLGRKDTTLEMMRDLHNNMVGISVARARDRGTSSDLGSRSELLVALARAGVLLRSEDDVSLSLEEKRRAKQSTDIKWAISWFDQNKAMIEKRVTQSLPGTRS
jgi:hypothetical protein